MDPRPLFLYMAFLIIAGESARLGGYNYGGSRPQSIYETPSRPAPKPFRPPQPTYSFPARPKPPTPSRPTQTYNIPSRPFPSRPRPTSTPVSGYRPAPSSIVTAQQNQPGMPYSFEWGVEDSASGNIFNHVESSDGRRTEGQYQVLLPDGRIQVVKFYDIGDGFIADVSYQ